MLRRRAGEHTADKCLQPRFIIVPVFALSTLRRVHEIRPVRTGRTLKIFRQPHVRHALLIGVLAKRTDNGNASIARQVSVRHLWSGPSSAMLSIEGRIVIDKEVLS